MYYGTWQIHGRRNTSLPYLILGMKRPVNRSILNFQHPSNKSLRIYFETMENTKEALDAAGIEIPYPHSVEIQKQEN